MMTRTWGIWAFACLPVAASAQGGEKDLRTKADALFAQGEYAQAMPLYSQLVSLTPSDRELSYRYGTCSLFGGEDKEKAIGFLKYATEGPTPPAAAWYFLGKAYHLTYQFGPALAAYEHYRGTADKKALAERPVDALEQQCRNGQNLLSNLKEIAVHNKVEVDGAEFFRFYDLSDIGGKIVVTPDELKTSLDKKSKVTGLVYLPSKGGPIYFSSLGKDGRTGRDIYRTELLPTGEFAAPVKLAGYINTDQDEDYACMAPDGRSFYFSSKGHNSMGGYDVFKSAYDPASDVFGPPENLDFAVNTPDDDLFYLVDAAGSEACFASGRDSKQGMLHVYRVGTAQAPINITVLKGTFSSQFDAKDRKAHIIVEDALSREQVADVRTDINGEYVLALPRSGKYKFMVQAGPSGRTHAGMVELPRSDRPQAFRQEMVLIDQGGEKLMIKNYFDEPLQEDIIALALDEIKRRARLDVTGTAPVAQVTEEAAPKGDAMVQAGFTDGRTVQDALAMAKEDAAGLEKRSAEEGEEARAAYALALANTEAAEQAADRAKQLVEEAGRTADEAQKNERMMEAARERQRSREANLRARAAHRTAQDLEAARIASQSKATQAAQLADRLAQAVQANDEAATVSALQRWKARLDERDAPGADVDVAERMRRAATEEEKEAAKKLQQATARRDEEIELADRIARLKREETDAKGSRKEALAKEIAQLSEQQGFLRDEVAKAFSKAKESERQAALARGQARLVQYLAAHATLDKAASLDEAGITSLGQRIGANETRIASTEVDERYDAALAEPTAAVEQRTFDWTRSSGQDAGAGTSRPTLASQQPSVTEDTRTATTTSPAAPATAQAAEAPGTDRRTAEATDGAMGTDTQASAAPRTTPANVPARADTETASMHGIAMPDSIQGPQTGRRTTDAAPAPVAAEDAEEETFLLSNQLSELHQLRAVERDKAVRDSLDRAIASLQERMRGTTTPDGPAMAPLVETPLQVEEATDMSTFGLSALDFDPARLDSLLLEDLYHGFHSDRRRILSNEQDVNERDAAINGLDMMLADSIDSQVKLQLATLERAPEKAAIILPRVDRLRTLKEAHLRTTTTASPVAQVPESAVPADPADPLASDGPAPHNDAYIAIAPRSERIYESLVDLRAKTTKDAVEEKDRDLERLVGLEDRVDSLEEVLYGMPGGKQRDKLRQRTDRLIDDHLILRTDLGQRLGYVMDQEFAAAQDSAKALDAMIAEKGLASTEPLLMRAQDIQRAAADAMTNAEALRKRAERSEDIVLRDSLYRQAYREELEALRGMDRAQTMRNYVLSGKSTPGEDIAYTVIERRMFGKDSEPGTWAAPEQVAGSTKEQQRPAAAPPASTQSTQTAAPVAAVVPAPPTTTAQPETARTEVETVVPRPETVAAVPPVPASAPIEEDPSVTAERAALKQHLSNYYFLSEEEQSLVLNAEDHSRYFRAKVKSLDQRERAAADIASADSSARAATALRQQAEALRKPQADGVPQERRLVEADTLDQQAARLSSRADSLQNVAANLDRAASVNDSQAAVLLQGLPEERSSSIMAMEQRSRRTATSTPTVPRPTEVAQAVPSRPTVPTPTPAAEQPRTSPPVQRTIPVEEMDSAPPAEPVRPTPVVAEPVPAPPVSVQQERPAAAPVEPPVVTPPAAQPQPTTPERIEPVVASVPAPVVAAPEPVVPKESAPERTVRPEVPEAPATSPSPAGMGALAADVFEFGEGAAKRTGPIPMDAPMPAGVVFKVQIGAFKKAIANDEFTDMTPVAGEHTNNGLVRYTAGMFTNAENATKAAQQVRERGYRDAFVVAYLDGKRVPLQQARRMVQGLSPLPAPSEQPTVTHAPAVIARPAVSAPTDGNMLSGYPASAEEVLAAFKPGSDAGSYYNDPTAAPAKQVETIKGLFFTVQVGVYSKPTALDRLFNITPLNSERTETGKIRYTTGIFLDLDRAKVRKDGTVALGVTDAFVTAYLNGKRIPMPEAKALLARFGDSILADPALMTR